MFTLVCDEEYPLESIDIIIYGVEKSQSILEDGMGIELNLPDWIRENRKVENGEIGEEVIQELKNKYKSKFETLERRGKEENTKKEK